MIAPHGGRLVDRVVDDEHADQLRAEIAGGPTIDLTPSTYQDCINISNGRYSPVEGFMTQNDFLKVVRDMTLEDGTVWTLPVVLDVGPKKATDLVTGTKVGLRAPSGETVGAIKVDEVFKYNSRAVASHVYGTDDEEHPGVRNFESRQDFLVGGRVYMFSEVRYDDVDLLPKETRVLFEHRSWSTVVGFQTRNAPHRAHEYIQKSALERVDGLLIQPKVGDKKDGDFLDEVILGAYQRLIESYYPADRTALSVFPSKMNYAGPREAVFDALVRKNHGCSHFIIGRDHAGVGEYYGGFDAQEIFDEVGDVGVKPMFFNYSFYCERCDGMTSEKVCPHGNDQRTYPSGSELRESFQSGTIPSEKVIRPEVAAYIMDAENPFVQPESSEAWGE